MNGSDPPGAPQSSALRAGGATAAGSAADTHSPHRGARPARLVSVRGFLVGLAGVLFVCLLTPFNDYIANDSSAQGTSLVGSSLPVALVLFFLFFALAINAPLRRWWPRAALGQGELALAMGMTLVSCAIPGSALLKYVPAHLVGIWGAASGINEYQRLLDKIDLPTWMFPATETGADALSRARDPVVRDYVGRAQVETDTFAAHWNAVPWRAWLGPAVAWGTLFGSFFGASIFMAVLVRRQWVENERLAFPLATLCGALIEEPRPGRAINETLRHPAFLVAFVLVFGIHAINALHRYFPQYWPVVPLDFNVSGLFVNPPWIYVDPWVTKAKLSFMAIGVTYFVSSRISFSIWACLLMLQVYRIATQYSGTDWPGRGFGDHLIGALVPYTSMIVWLGRHEWAMVIRRMFARGNESDPPSKFLPFAVAGWGLVLCTGGMFAWLMLAGASWFGSTILVAFMLTLMLVLMRIVAETGIFAIQFLLPMHRPWQYLFKLAPSFAQSDSVLKPYFLTCFLNVHFTVTQRESLPVFVSQSLRQAEIQAPEASRGRWQGFLFVAGLVVALLVGYVAAGGSLLFYEYKYAATLDARGVSPVNAYGVGESATYALVDAARLQTLRSARPETISISANLIGGATVTSVLAALSLRFAWWPIHPLGYLLLFSWTTWAIWASVFVGWAAKALLLRVGGSSLYRASQPFFIGLLLAESAAIGFWLCVSLVCLVCGWDYHAINILPF